MALLYTIFKYHASYVTCLETWSRLGENLATVPFLKKSKIRQESISCIILILTETSILPFKMPVWIFVLLAMNLVSKESKIWRNVQLMLCFQCFLKSTKYTYHAMTSRITNVGTELQSNLFVFSSCLEF